PRLHPEELAQTLIDALHAVEPGSALTEIHLAHRQLPAARAPPVLQVLAVAERFEHQVTGSVELALEDHGVAFDVREHLVANHHVPPWWCWRSRRWRGRCRLLLLRDRPPGGAGGRGGRRRASRGA